MFTVTEKASEMIKEFLKGQKNHPPIRITSQIGWGGPTLGMALDESSDDDMVFIDRDIKFIIDKQLLADVKPISIDFVESAGGSGFKLTSSLAAGEGCGTSCSC